MNKHKTHSRLVVFLYLLMRDKLPVGAVEECVQEVEKSNNPEFVLSNGYLGKYAEDLAERIYGCSFQPELKDE